MTKHLQRDMESLGREIITQSSLVEEMISKASRALYEVRVDLANEVIEKERAINESEVKIEEECLKILALHQPVAVDLRKTATVLKINNDLERIADLAVNIAERTIGLSHYPNFRIPASLEPMTKITVSMLRDAIDAFVDFDTEKARDVCRRDDIVDGYNREIINEIYLLMHTDPELIKPALHFFSSARHIERIADHTTNIAEDVIYLTEGEIVRHRHKQTFSS
ncbi:phosphate signaling complex protein PhoU [uncultured Gimesia sp.]|uniref:phosphate signaling complex protein PhoU n=1 Tax=uncultured Gimesia sp. TaxID=1678688 RepID=UPI002630869A|nr:phosphate signaling complex protein PhoU [uncultured Gimesia sp.]